MNTAVKLNPNFASAFLDRGVAYFDKHDFDRTLAGREAEIAAQPSYAINADARGGSYENQREGDRIVQDASEPIPSFRYNAVAYSPDTYPAASAALLPPEPARAGNPAGAHAEMPVAQRTTPESAAGMPGHTLGPATQPASRRHLPRRERPASPCAPFPFTQRGRRNRSRKSTSRSQNRACTSRRARRRRMPRRAARR
jgi:hypothetical protein